MADRRKKTEGKRQEEKETEQKGTYCAEYLYFFEKLEDLSVLNLEQDPSSLVGVSILELLLLLSIVMNKLESLMPCWPSNLELSCSLSISRLY